MKLLPSHVERVDAIATLSSHVPLQFSIKVPLLVCVRFFKESLAVPVTQSTQRAAILRMQKYHSNMRMLCESSE